MNAKSDKRLPHVLAGYNTGPAVFQCCLVAIWLVALLGAISYGVREMITGDYYVQVQQIKLKLTLVGCVVLLFASIPTVIGHGFMLVNIMRRKRRALFVDDGFLIYMWRGKTRISLAEIKDVRLGDIRAGWKNKEFITIERSGGRELHVKSDLLDRNAGDIVNELRAIR